MGPMPKPFFRRKENIYARRHVEDVILKKFEGHPETLKRKECVKFTRREQPSSLCTCGRLESEHRKEETQDSSTQFKEKKTDAYGDIHFRVDGRLSQAKFVRLSDETEPERGLTLLLRHWKLKKPKILISVTGGAKDFFLNSEQKRAFSNGLRKVVETTNVWVITGGTNVGVMKEVGKALRGLSRINYGSSLNKNKRSKVSLIGIAAWGALKDRQKFVNDKEKVKLESSMYRPSNLSYPDNNHSYFLFVDNGKVKEYGGEIAFRAALEKTITSSHLVRSEDGPEKVPAVQLVVGGGPNTVKTVAESIALGIPVVIFQNTGRGADIIADALNGKYENWPSHSPSIHGASQLFIDVGELLFPEKQQNKARKITEIVTMLHNICSYPQFVSIYNIDEPETLDAAILKAWMKCGKEELKAQLKLAIVWNRVDIAYDCIKSWKREKKSFVIDDLNGLMKTVLKHGRVNFFDLLTSNGVDINNFLTLDVLLELYNLRIHKGRQVLAKYMDYEKDYALQYDDLDRLLGIAVGEFLKKRYSEGSPVFTANGSTFKYPFHELFLWAVINNMQETAKYFWNKGDESLAKSLIACLVLRRLARVASLRGLEDAKKLLEQQQREFEAIAVNLVNISYTRDETEAEKLLKYELKYWGKETCLHLAVLAQNEEFVASIPCQNTLSKIWYGELEPHGFPTIRAVFGIIFPFLIPWFKYKEEPCEEKMPDEVHGNELMMGDLDETDYKEPEKSSHCCQGISNIVSKFYKFYTAPITKFWGNALLYIAFLGLFTSVILIRLPEQPSVTEWIIFMYVCTLTLEEVRQIAQAHGISVHTKLLAWMARVWNLCDGLGIVLYFLGFGLRLSSSTRSQGRVLLSLDICIWIIRLLDIFSTNKYFGPYIFMIGKMCKEMAYFLFIMLVFLLAFGVLRLAVLEPRQSWSMSVIPDVFYKPYFQIYGELFLSDGSSKTTVFGTVKEDNYAESIILVALALYLLIGNILLLNLLIAIFNNIYTQTEARSLQLWGFNRYHVIEEFHTKPALAPPFVIFSHIATLGNKLFPHCSRKIQSRLDGKFKIRVNKIEEFRELMSFEESCATEKSLPSDLLKQDGQRSDVISRLQHSIKTIIKSGSHDEGAKRIEYVQDFRPPVLEPAPGRSFGGDTVALETLLKDVVSNKGRSRQSSDEEDNRRRVTSLKKIPAVDEEMGINKETDEGCLPVHHLSRHSPYPGTSIRRSVVPDALISWKVPLPTYAPLLFSLRPTSSDKDKVDPDLPCDPLPRFNEVDGDVDRRSKIGTYEIVQRFPRNPQGRTGLRGRGKFSRWGPNHHVKAILTRWKVETVEDDIAGPVLQYLLIRRGKMYFIPSGTVAIEERMPAFLLSSLLEMLNREQNFAGYEVQDLEPFLSTGIQLYAGYLDHQLNTDNAWFEVSVINFHDQKGAFLSSTPDTATIGGTTYEWMDSDNYINAASNQLEYLKSVADVRNAAFYYLV